jgi:hypothetical protein
VESPPAQPPHVYPTRIRRPPDRLNLICTYHMTARRATKENPDEAVPVTKKELETLLHKHAFLGVNYENMDAAQREGIIRSQMNVTQKYSSSSDGNRRMKDNTRAYGASTSSKAKATLPHISLSSRTTSLPSIDGEWETDIGTHKTYPNRVFLGPRPHHQENRQVGLLPHRIHDRRHHDEAPPRSTFSNHARQDHGRRPVAHGRGIDLNS